MTANVVEPTAKMAALAPLAGRWRTSGRVVATGEAFRATDIYEWFPGGYFLLHHVDADMAGEPVRTLEIFGYDAEQGAITATAYDNAGGITRSRIAVAVRSISIDGETERFRGNLSADGQTIDGLWEQRQGDLWQPWLETRLVQETAA